MNFIILVLLGAVVAIYACSCLGTVGADVLIGSSFEIGTLSNVSEQSALFELGNSRNQESWRQLADETWHESAFWSFFVGVSLDAWNSSNVTINATSDLIPKLQAISTTNYHINRFITGTGNIEASVWTIMFSCGPASCTDGYMVPIVSVPYPEQGSTTYSYVTAWLPVTDGVLMNAIPASIHKEVTQTISGEDDSPNHPASITFNIQAYLPPCPKARVHSFRTLLDSAYGLAPALTCIGFSDDDADSFMIILTNASLAINDGSTTWKQILESLEIRLLTVSQWSQQAFEKCSQRPLLILSEGSDSLPHMCHHNKCMIFFPKDITSQNQTGVQFLKGLEKVLDDEGPSQCRSMSSTCESNISSFYDLDSTDLEPFTTSLRRSDWASEQGKHTSEFDYAPHGESTLTACAIELTSPPSNQLNRPVREIHIQAIDYLTAFIIEHNTAFTTDKGPATDRHTFYALLITTTLSVITVDVSLTDFMLRAICHVRPAYFNIQKGKNGGAKVFIKVFFNVGLALVFFLPVISLARNEMDRQIKFSTWALASDDLVVEDFSPHPIRIVYLFDVTSQYHSNFLVPIVLVFCFTCLIVAVCTVRRCLQVFERYRLLVAAAGKDGIMQALKAIEMGDAEYLELILTHE